ncbi:protein of unknown function (plasmid) [Paraburkholderia kururiensis]
MARTAEEAFTYVGARGSALLARQWEGADTKDLNGTVSKRPDVNNFLARRQVIHARPGYGHVCGPAAASAAGSPVCRSARFDTTSVMPGLWLTLPFRECP